MRKTVQTLLMVVVIAPMLTACVTRGTHRRDMANVNQRIDEERQARVAGDSAIRADISNLRNDLDGMRRDFDARIVAMEEGLQFALPVNFAFDDATVRAEDRAKLDRFVQVAQRHYPGATITVEGFTDPAGSRAYNMRLSQRRAEAVQQYLTSQGLTDRQVRAVGMGPERQVFPGAWGDDPGGLENRRVVFVIETRGDVRVEGVASNY
jgi:peptidoglycan-associated lipoprotein